MICPDYEQAEAAFEAAIDLCRTHGRRPEERVCLSCLALVLYNRGEWARAGALAEELLACESTNDIGKAHALPALGLIAVARGATKQARSRLRAALALGRALSLEGTVIEARVGLALADNLDGNGGEAWQPLVDSPPKRLALFYVHGLRLAATFAAQRRETRLIQLCADVLADWATRFGSRDALAGLAHALGEVALLEDDAERACEQFARALEVLRELDAPFDRAHVEVRAGVALAAAGEREAAVERIVAGYRTFRKLGSRPFSLQAAAELEALGEPVDRRLGRRAAGDRERGGLTRRELEVVRLVAVGRTNREIARELFLSPRTVEMHVGNALAKLDCRSRTEATGKAHELGLLEPAVTR